MIGPTTAVILNDDVDPEDLLPDGAGPDWRVAHVEIRRDGEVLATLQVTPHDIVVFPGAQHNIGIIRDGERAVTTDRSVGIYERTDGAYEKTDMPERTFWTWRTIRAEDLCSGDIVRGSDGVGDVVDTVTARDNQLIRVDFKQRSIDRVQRTYELVSAYRLFAIQVEDN